MGVDRLLGGAPGRCVQLPGRRRPAGRESEGGVCAECAGSLWGCWTAPNSSVCSAGVPADTASSALRGRVWPAAPRRARAASTSGSIFQSAQPLQQLRIGVRILCDEGPKLWSGRGQLMQLSLRSAGVLRLVLRGSDSSPGCACWLIDLLIPRRTSGRFSRPKTSCQSGRAGALGLRLCPGRVQAVSRWGSASCEPAGWMEPKRTARCGAAGSRRAARSRTYELIIGRRTPQWVAAISAKSR